VDYLVGLHGLMTVVDTDGLEWPKSVQLSVAKAVINKDY